MISVEFWIGSLLLGISELPQKYGASNIYYCYRCGKVYGKRIVRNLEVEAPMPFTAQSGVCLDCKPASRWCGVPGAIPRFARLDEPIPYRVVEYQFECELSYVESLCPTSQTPVSHPSISLV